MRKRVVSAIAMLGISLLVGYGQVSEMPDAGESSGAVEQEGKLDKADGSAEKESPSISETEAGIEESIFIYELQPEGTVWIAGVKDKTLEKMDIPNMIEGSKVVTIRNNAFKDCGNLTNVTIAEGVEYIGSYAFRGCSSLTSIVVPGSVTGKGAFMNVVA